MATFGDFNLNITATYRLQFHKGFTFRDGARIANYLRELGISHVYSSPILTASAGSMHGYDIIDFQRINPELGGEEGFEHLASALREVGIGLIIDIVPNHMCVGGCNNAYWLDLLQKGEDSAYADFFDVDFNAIGMERKILVPFLGASYSETLASDDLKIHLREEDGRYAVYYHDHCFPLRDRDQLAIASQGAAAFSSPEALHGLLTAQHYRLASWRTANDTINYRRFFEITTLAGVKIERPAAFERVHQVPLQLYARGLIDGVRVDHIDGLTDPAAYCETLHAALERLRPERPEGRRQPAYIVLEKILAGDEHLPNWKVDGTTGYDFMNEVSALQHAEAGAPALDRYWREVSDRAFAFDEEERLARRELLGQNFSGQLETVVDALLRCGEEMLPDQDMTRSAVRRATISVISHLRVYRSYALGGRDNPGLGPDLAAAFETALEDVSADEQAIKLVRAVMESQSENPAFGETIRRFNQLTAPVAAKAVEDTAFYRFGRLLSRNDVGFEAKRLGMEIPEFHGRMAYRATSLPHSMLTTATHDHKRGEDVRARLAILSEIPEKWIDQCRAWSALNAELFGAKLASADEYMLYQMIVGAWPFALDPGDRDGLRDYAKRLAEWQNKALREGKLRSSWLSPKTAYEEAAERHTLALLDPERNAKFLKSVHAFVSDITSATIVNSLTQTALRCLAPGAPDLYQGSELWDLTLVDPDNRRPVDFEHRAALLGDPSTPRASGAIKQGMIRDLLRLRREEVALFAHGDYSEIKVRSPSGAEVVAFTRGHEGKTLVVAMLLRVGSTLYGSDTMTPPSSFWGDARLDVRSGGYRPIWGDAESPTLPLSAIFVKSPVAVWISH